MGAVGSVAVFPSSLKGFSAGEDFDAVKFQTALNAWCRTYALECSKPFLTQWYNDKRLETAGSTQLIEAPEAAVCFALYSVPGFLDVVAEHFLRIRPANGFVDSTTDEILARLRADLAPALDAFVVNTDEGPPYYHVQTVGDVAAVDQHVEAEQFASDEAAKWREELSDKLEDHRDTKMWGTDTATLRKIFGVNVHPVWGGWYAYRALVVLRGASAKNLPKPEPLTFLSEQDARRILSEYNLRHQECLWRDLSAEGHPPERRYTTDEFFFFTETSPAKRRRWLELRVAQMERGGALSRLPCCSR